EVAQLLPIDFDRSFNSEGKDSVGSASNDSRGHYSASDDEYDDDDYLECNEGRESGEKMVGGADDGNGWGDANDAAELGSEDAAEFVVARDGIASLTKTLQQRFVDKVGSKLGLSPVSGIEDPVVSKTKGAPRKGKECVPISQGERTPKRRRCTNCGEASHTKRTCTWHPGEGVAGNDDAGGPSYMEHDSQDAAAPCATPEARHCHTNEVGMQSESGNHGDTVPAHADGTNPCIGVGGGGPNFFLGGQHIEQFYSANSCSGHTGQQSSQAPCPRLRNPSAWTNEEWFERWMTQ
ncbi:hypothetical protein S245_021661, partial [Arachis hypogaea]